MLKNLLYSLFFITSPLIAHCQLPCGIYHDDLRFAQLEENIQTLNRAIKGILDSGAHTPLAENQRVRWIILKEENADQFVQVLTTYFLQQRLKPDQEGFDQMLFLVYQMMQTSMLIKQQVNGDLVDRLQSLLSTFRQTYSSNESAK